MFLVPYASELTVLLASTRRLVLLTALFAAGPSFAQTPAPSAPTVQTPELAAVLGTLQSTYADVTTLQAQFTQTVTSELVGQDTQRGELVVQRPAKMRWSFQSGKVFVSDGRVMHMHDPALKQVIRYPNFAQQASAVDSLLQSLDRLDAHFLVELVSTGEEGHVLDLKPLASQAETAQFQTVRLTFGPDAVIQQVRVADAFGGQTVLTFDRVNLKAAVPDSTFDFEVPAGVEVIDAG